MNAASAAEVKAALKGIELPSEKGALLAYAVQQRAEPSLLDALQSVPDREYESLDEVVEELLHVQPLRDLSEPSQPHEESGQPPGGTEDYVTAHPSDTGQVRDLEQAE
jgi:hypothetical protein